MPLCWLQPALGHTAACGGIIYSSIVGRRSLRRQTALWLSRPWLLGGRKMRRNYRFGAARARTTAPGAILIAVLGFCSTAQAEPRAASSSSQTAGGSVSDRVSDPASDSEAELRALAAESQSDGQLQSRSAVQTAEAVTTAGESAGEEKLDVVGIVAQRVRRASGSLHVISSATLERYKYDDPHATLQLVPGVYVRQEDGFGLRPNIGIRGAISDRSKKITLLEDGVLFGPAPYSAPAAYYFPLMGRMQQMRVVKGPAAVRYGPQTVGGAIELITRNIPNTDATSLDLTTGQYGYGKLHTHFGSQGARTGFVVEGVHLRSSGFKQLPSDEDTGFFRNEWMLKAGHSFRSATSLNHRISLKLTYSDEASNETYLGLTDADLRANPDRRYGTSSLDRMKWHRTSAVVSHELQLQENLTLKTDVYRHDLHRTWTKANHFAGAALFDVLAEPESPRNRLFYDLLTGETDGSGQQEYLLIGPNQRRYASQGVQSSLQWDRQGETLTHHLEAGVRLHYDFIRRRHSEDAYQIVNGAPVSAGVPTLTTTRNEAESLALAIHVYDEIRWGALTLTPGLRLETIGSKFHEQLTAELARSDKRTVVVPLAGLGLHYALTPAFGVLVGANRGMSPPAPGTDESVKPEISLNYELGFRYLHGFARAELIGYFNDYQNLTDVCTLSGGCTGANLDTQFDAGRARIYGVEALLEETLLFPQFSVPLSASYTLTRTEFLETFVSQNPIFGEVEAGDELPYVPRHQGRASIGLDFEPLSGYLAGSWSTAMREQSGAGPLSAVLATDRQFTLDVGATWQLLDELQGYANWRNILNRRVIVSRRPYGARPNAPRWLQVGLRATWQ